MFALGCLALGASQDVDALRQLGDEPFHSGGNILSGLSVVAVDDAQAGFGDGFQGHVAARRGHLIARPGQQVEFSTADRAPGATLNA